MTCIAHTSMYQKVTAFQSRGVHPIAVGEILCHLASQLCCQFARPYLTDYFLPHGQVCVLVYQVALKLLSMLFATLFLCFALMIHLHYLK